MMGTFKVATAVVVLHGVGRLSPLNQFRVDIFHILVPQAETEYHLN